jgi:hypothetical protein
MYSMPFSRLGVSHLSPRNGPGLAFNYGQRPFILQINNHPRTSHNSLGPAADRVGLVSGDCLVTTDIDRTPVAGIGYVLLVLWVLGPRDAQHVRW